jgi:hypothetical protein
MALHLLKLAVGCETTQDLIDWIEETRAQYHRLGRPYEQLHTTRMVPKRADEIINASGGENGSLYWVIKGQLSARQRLLDIRPFVGQDGISRCHLVLDPVVFAVRPRPFRPFQGWRYLEGKDAQPDIGSGPAETVDMPEPLRRELASMGLL